MTIERVVMRWAGSLCGAGEDRLIHFFQLN